MIVTYADSFASDLDAITELIHAESPQRAVDFLMEIAGVCAGVIAFDPTAGYPQDDFQEQMYCFVARGYLIFYSFVPVFNLIHFYCVVRGQDESWRDLED